MDKELLKDIGLTNGEVKTYLALLDLGETTVTPLSKKADVTTGKIYGILDKLIDKGLATFIYKNKVKYFSPTNPQKISDYMDKKMKLLQKQDKLLEKILPELERKINSAQKDVRAEIFMGWEGLETAYREMINSFKKGDIDYVLGANKGITEEKVKRFYGRVLNKTYEKGIKIKVIYQENSKEYFKTSLGETKHVVPKYLQNTTPSEINIYNNTIMIIIHLEVPILIRITSKEVHDSFLAYFETLWKIAKK